LIGTFPAWIDPRRNNFQIEADLSVDVIQVDFVGWFILTVTTPELMAQIKQSRYRARPVMT